MGRGSGGDGVAGGWRGWGGEGFCGRHEEGYWPRYRLSIVLVSTSFEWDCLHTSENARSSQASEKERPTLTNREWGTLKPKAKSKKQNQKQIKVALGLLLGIVSGPPAPALKPFQSP